MKQKINELGLWDFGYLGVAHVFSLQILYVLRKSLSLMEIWEGCMHFKRQGGGSSKSLGNQARLIKPKQTNKNKKTQLSEAKLHTSNMVYQFLCIFFP